MLGKKKKSTSYQGRYNLAAWTKKIKAAKKA